MVMINNALKHNCAQFTSTTNRYHVKHIATLDMIFGFLRLILDFSKTQQIDSNLDT